MEYVFNERELNELIAHVYELDNDTRKAVEAARANRNNRRTLYRAVRRNFLDQRDIRTLETVVNATV